MLHVIHLITYGCSVPHMKYGMGLNYPESRSVVAARKGRMCDWIILLIS